MNWGQGAVDDEEQRRVMIENLLIASGEPYTEQDIQDALNEVDDFPQEVQKIPLVEPADDETITIVEESPSSGESREFPPWSGCRERGLPPCARRRS